MMSTYNIVPDILNFAGGMLAVENFVLALVPSS